MASKPKKNKTKKTETLDYLNKVKDLYKANEPIFPVQEGFIGGFNYPLEFLWRDQNYQVQNMIGRWQIDINQENQQVRNCYRLELNQGFQVDIAYYTQTNNWTLIGVEPALLEKVRKSKS